MIEVSVEYYASLKDFSNKPSETLATNAKTVKELFLEIQEKYKFNFDDQHLRAALNDDFVEWSEKIKSGDKVVFIPPVAGG